MPLSRSPLTTTTPMLEIFEMVVVCQLLAVEIASRAGNGGDMPRIMAKRVKVEYGSGAGSTACGCRRLRPGGPGRSVVLLGDKCNDAILRSRSIMTEKLYDYDPAASLEGEEAISVFLAGALGVDLTTRLHEPPAVSDERDFGGGASHEGLIVSIGSVGTQ